MVRTRAGVSHPSLLKCLLEVGGDCSTPAGRWGKDSPAPALEMEMIPFKGSPWCGEI